MNKTLVFAIVIFFMFFSNSCSRPNEFLIDSEKAGLFNKNMSADVALQIAQEKYTAKESAISMEGDDYLVYEIFLDSELLLKLEPVCEGDCPLRRIWVYSDRFKTNKGIGVGSTVSELLEKYTFDYLETEGFAICLFVKELDVCFNLDKKALTYEWFRGGAQFEDIPKDTEITLIFP